MGSRTLERQGSVNEDVVRKLALFLRNKGWRICVETPFPLKNDSPEVVVVVVVVVVHTFGWLRAPTSPCGRQRREKRVGIL